MPNVKIFVDETVLAENRAPLSETLLPMRDMLCDKLDVPVAACQIAVLPVAGLPDQPLANVEIQILPKPERTRDVVEAVCASLRDMIGGVLGVRTAVRASALDPETYVALK